MVKKALESMNQRNKAGTFQKRSLLLSAFLSLLAPGLGHTYNGKIILGIIFFCSYLLFSFLLYFFDLWKSFYGLIIHITLLAAFFLFVIIHSVLLAKSNQNYQLKKYNRVIFYLLWVALFWMPDLIFNEIATAKSYRMPTNSMQPTFYAGDYLIADLSYYNDIKIKSGDLVIFKFPLDKELNYVKRCFGVPGDTVEIIDKKVYINGIHFNDSGFVQYADKKTLKRDEGILVYPAYQDNFYGSRDNFGPVIVPRDHYFMLGDNRDNSSDSRQWGFIPKENILSKPLYIYFSYTQDDGIRWDRFGRKLE